MESFISCLRRTFLLKLTTSRIVVSPFSTRSDVAKYYVTLGVPINSDQETVRLAFIELVKKYHPDSKSPNANAVKFQEVEHAYRKLQDKFASDRFNVNEGLGEYGLYYEEKEEDGVERPDINWWVSDPLWMLDTNFSLTVVYQMDHVSECGLLHTAPQHRQYLSYEGLGSGTPFQRFKQYNVHKAAKAVENVTQYRINKLSEENPDCKQVMKKESKRKVKDIRTGFGMDRLVEDLIQESISRGEFDNLTGSGKPLKPTTTENNPYVDFVTHKMNQVLIENGFTPTWITLQKEIRESTEELRKRLFKLRETMGPLPLTDKENHYWQQITTILSDEVKQINGKIDSYNLLVPLLHQQMFHLSIQKEAEEALFKGPHKQVQVDDMNKSEEESSSKKKGLRKFFPSIFQ